MRSLLEDLQNYLTDRLSTRDVFAGIEILDRSRGDLASRIEESLNRLGRCIIVLPPSATIGTTETPSVEFEEVRIPIVCYEKPDLALPGPSALAMAEWVLAHLHHHTPRIDGVTSPLISAQDAILPIDEQSPDNVIQVNLRLAGGVVGRANQS